MNLVEELLQAIDQIAQLPRSPMTENLMLKIRNLLYRAAIAIEQLEKDNVDARSKCICVFCKVEFSKTDLSGAVEHLCSCDKSPLVQRGRQLFEQVEQLQKALRAISDMNGAHIADDGGDMDQDPSCYCARCIAVRALS